MMAHAGWHSQYRRAMFRFAWPASRPRAHITTHQALASQWRGLYGFFNIKLQIVETARVFVGDYR